MQNSIPAPIYTQPNWNLPEKDKDSEWFSQNIRHFCTYYNRPYHIWSDDNPAENLSPVERGLNYSLYYLGKQKNINYNHLAKDSSGNTLQNTWIKSNKVKNLVDNLCGEYIKQLSAKILSAKSLSPRAQSEKMKMWEDEMLKYDRNAKKILDVLAANGIQYQSPLGDKFNSQQDSERWMNYSFKDDLEEAATEIAKYIEWSNDSDTMYVEALKQDFAPSNKIGIYNFVENNKVKQKKIPFYSLITDPVSDDPFMRDQRFVGFIDRFSPQQIQAKWGDKLTATEMEEIIKMSAFGNGSNEFMSAYNTGTVGWWMQRDSSLIASVTVFWIAPRDTRYIYDEDRFGNKKLMKAGKKEENKAGDYSVMDVHYGTLIGNKYLVESGYCKNVVRSIEKKENPELPIKVLNGDTVLGDGVSVIGCVAQLIDRMDALDFKLMDMVSRHKGKSYIINGSKLSVKSRELIQDFASMNISVSEGVSGEAGSPADNQPLVYPVDFGLDAAIMEYASLYREMERRVENLFNLPPVSLGQQQGEIGKSVQMNTISMASTGNMNLYQNLYRFNEINLQYCVNLAKIIYSQDSNDEIAPLILGDRGIKVLEIIKKRSLEDVLIKISIKDIITETEKAQIMQIAQALSQNNGIDILDVLTILRGETLPEIHNDLEYAVNKRKKETAQQQQMQMEAEKARNDAMNQTQIQLAQIAQDAHNQRSKESNIAKIGVKDMELSANKEKQQAA